MSTNSFNSKRNLDVAGKSYEIFDITKIDGASNLPFSLKILLENLLRTEEGANITADHIKALANYSQTIPNYIKAFPDYSQAIPNLILQTLNLKLK